MPSQKSEKINREQTKLWLESLDALERQIDGGTSRVALELVGAEAVKLAKIAHPYEDHTGALTKSITSSPGRIGTRGPFVIVSASKPALWVEKGTKPHIITPKRGRYLRFFVKGKKGAVFAKKVKHPGSRPHPFLKPAIEAVGRGARGIALWKSAASALRVAQGIQGTPGPIRIKGGFLRSGGGGMGLGF